MNPHRFQFVLNHTNDYRTGCMEFFHRPILRFYEGSSAVRISLPVVPAGIDFEETLGRRIRAVSAENVSSWTNGFNIERDGSMWFSTWVGKYGLTQTLGEVLASAEESESISPETMLLDDFNYPMEHWRSDEPA